MRISSRWGVVLPFASSRGPAFRTLMTGVRHPFVTWRGNLMERLLGVALMTVLATGQVRADEKDAKAILEKAIQGLGGEQKLAKAAESATWKAKGKINFGGN